MGADEISANASTDAEADWATHTNNDWAVTKGGGLNFCLLKPPAVVTPRDKIHLTLIALPQETNTVVKDT